MVKLPSRKSGEEEEKEGKEKRSPKVKQSGKKIGGPERKKEPRWSTGQSREETERKPEVSRGTGRRRDGRRDQFLPTGKESERGVRTALE